MPVIRHDLIAPFLDAVHMTFDRMTGRTVERIEVYRKLNHVMFGDITGSIGLSGKISGTAAVTLPAQVALSVITEMMHEEPADGIGDPAVQDGVGELINMIAGGAKTTLSGTEDAIDFSLPTIISGRGHQLYHRPGTVTISTIFRTDRDEEFAVDISVQEV